MMTMQRILRDLMNKWEIEAYVLVSLGFQIVLVLLAPMRRWSKNNFKFLVIWSVYLLATFFASFALTLINSSDTSDDILVFWAPFLLVHLGGPHTITALAIEDNNFWHRQMLTHIVQVFSVLFVFYRFKIFRSEWLFPTAVIFAIGIVKCIERTHSLHLASMTFMRRSIRKKKGKGLIGDDDTSMDDGECGKEYQTMLKGYDYYQTFKGFIVDHTFTHHECGTGKDYLSTIDEEEAFEVMEVELNFLYDAMYTKMIVIQYYWKNYVGWGFRFACYALLFTVAVMFYLHPKQNITPRDTFVTYCLLSGALVLDGLALAHLNFSESTMVKIMNSKLVSVRVKGKILAMINFVRKLITVNKRWSRKMRQYSLIDHSLNRRWKWAERTLDFLSLKDSIDLLLYTTTADVEKSLKKLVLDDIKKKAEPQHEPSSKCEEDHCDDPNLRELQQEPASKREDHFDDPNLENLMKVIRKAFGPHNTDDYAMFVLTLHLATEICYFYNLVDDEEREKDSDAVLCKQISEYLAFLLVMEENIMSAVPKYIGIRFKDMSWEAIQHTLEELDNTFQNAEHRRKACLYLVDEYNPTDEMHNTENIKLSLLSKGVRLARDLINCSDTYTTKDKQPDDDPDVENPTSEIRINPKELWASLSRVWVGLLLYASSHCRGDVYYLNRGGEFHTFVRLLMAHFGLKKRLRGERQFRPNNHQIN